MANRRHERTLARRQAIQVLYQSEILEIAPAKALAEGHAFVDDVTPSAYAVALIEGVGEHLKAIDEQLSACSENWALDRMPLMDRAILRLACYEMIFVDDVPVSVAINEAVDLAKDFGGEDDSPKFVNGVLGKIAKLMEQGAVSKAALSGNPATAEGAAIAASEAYSEAEEPADALVTAPDAFASKSSAE